MSINDHLDSRKEDPAGLEPYIAPGVRVTVTEQPPQRVTHRTGNWIAPLYQVAREYTEAAGRAFARGDDEVALQMRKAAKDIQDLIEKLPPLPAESVAMRGHL